MREGIGSIFLYNLIIIFIVLVFAFLAATLSYYKAFKVNNRIISIIEKYEGYNTKARASIGDTLRTIGYSPTKVTCPSTKNGGVLQPQDATYPYCVYMFGRGTGESAHYNSYGIVTYIYFDFPFFNTFIKLPIYTKSDRIYDFW